jgi:hypothetical protein
MNEREGGRNMRHVDKNNAQMAKKKIITEGRRGAEKSS